MLPLIAGQLFEEAKKESRLHKQRCAELQRQLDRKHGRTREEDASQTAEQFHIEVSIVSF